ncbi:MAG TPA: winged helix-turn-helix domain-containing protein [Streptosporangiaceae bacterium]
MASWLRIRIEAGEFRPEIDPLPSEKELGELFEVARETARRAVAVLREEGLVRTVPQRGTYVIDRKRPRKDPASLGNVWLSPTLGTLRRHEPGGGPPPDHRLMGSGEEGREAATAVR